MKITTTIVSSQDMQPQILVFQTHRVKVFACVPYSSQIHCWAAVFVALRLGPRPMEQPPFDITGSVPSSDVSWLEIREWICFLGLPKQNTVDWVVQPTKMYFLTVLEAGSSRSRSQQGWFLLRHFLLLCPHMYFSLCIYFPSVSFSSYKDTSPIGLGPPS